MTDAPDPAFRGMRAADLTDPTALPSLEALLEQLLRSLEACFSEEELARAGAIQASVGPIRSVPREDAPRLDIRAGDFGLQVFLLAITQHTAAAFTAWLDEGSALVRIQDLDGWELLAYVRRAANIEDQYRGGRPKWTAAQELREVDRRSATEFDERALGEWMRAASRLDPKWERPGYALSHNWTPQETERVGRALPEQVAEQIKPLLPILGRLVLATRSSRATKAPALDRASWRAQG
jgi:hypothetical protein